MIITDVLSFLAKNERISDNIANAPHGALVKALGTLLFVDRYMLETAVLAMDIASASQPKQKHQRGQGITSGFAVVKKLLSKIDLPSSFLLQMGGNIQIAGTIKESGMEETHFHILFQAWHRWIIGRISNWH